MAASSTWDWACCDYVPERASGSQRRAREKVLFVWAALYTQHLTQLNAPSDEDTRWSTTRLLPLSRQNGKETNLGVWKGNGGTGAQLHKYILRQTDASTDINICSSVLFQKSLFKIK